VTEQSGGPAADLTPEELAFLAGLFDHARNGATGALADAVDRGVPVNLTNSAGDTFLILAAYHTHEDTVAALLERGADHARVNDKGQTALAAAVFRQSEPVVRRLLEAGADPALGPRSALAVAEFFDLPAMAALLRSPGD
jgi:ankyrin repeat protein